MYDTLSKLLRFQKDIIGPVISAKIINVDK